MAVANMPMRLLLQVADNDPVLVAEFEAPVQLTRAGGDASSATYTVDGPAFAEGLRLAVTAAAEALQAKLTP
ncbi:hypothetical protein [Agrococcus casei]|uniref:Uncharacterized protein n=1 Tax=Agrococcus casei LMG 22410 TaxID=1255656 RepID=A0A1R4FGN0_9MICO|nr:hypothetical protein [Agrococcus casei]SJM55017.1 hypothetical protein CZ674_04430 [Agrococcus casei LMG 22410]